MILRDEDKIIIKFVAFALLILVVGITSTMSNGEKYVYECTDWQGNIVYCTSYVVRKGNAWGFMEDGTEILITSYKRIPRSEVSKQ